MFSAQVNLRLELQEYQSEFKNTLLKVTETVFIDIILSLMSLGQFYSVMGF